MEQIDISVNTQPGVRAAFDPAGLVTVVREPGSTLVQLVVNEGNGQTATVWLDYTQVTEAMVALGAAAAAL